MGKIPPFFQFNIISVVKRSTMWFIDEYLCSDPGCGLDQVFSPLGLLGPFEMVWLCVICEVMRDFSNFSGSDLQTSYNCVICCRST